MEFSGKWEPKIKLTHSARIEGFVQVEGFTDAAPMKGTLSVKLPLVGVELAAEFTDSQGRRCSVRAKTGTVLNAAARHISVKGALSRSAMQLGEVDLQVDWSLVKKALPSLR